MAMLRMLDELFDDPNRGPAFVGAARETVLYLLVAPAVWRAGKTAAAVRYNAVMALSTFLERRLCPPETLLGCLSDGGGMQVLPTVMTCMDEDYYADTRRAGTYLMEMMLQVSQPPAQPPCSLALPSHHVCAGCIHGAVRHRPANGNLRRCDAGDEEAGARLCCWL